MKQSAEQPGRAALIDEGNCVRIEGDMTFATVPDLFRQVGDRAGPLDCVDLAAVGSADSAGLALLLEWEAHSRRQGRDIEFINAPASLMHLARLSEADDLLKLRGRGRNA